MKLTEFTNDRYRLLQYLKKNEMMYNDSIIIKLSQDEMANSLGVSKHKVNTLVKELIALKVLGVYDLKGKYIITQLGNKVLDAIEGRDNKAKASQFKCASFFAGVGGIDLGFEQVGFQTIYANEIDVKAVHTYELNFGLKVDNRDIHDVVMDLEEGKDIFNGEDIDILLAGFPCQAFSVAGYREGFDDKKGRGGLFFEIMKIVRAKKPPVVFLENVKNLVGHDNGKTFKIIREALESEGYYIKYKVLNSMDYGNVPQNRERIYIVAFSDENQWESFEFPKQIPLENKLRSVIDFHSKVEEKFYYTEERFKHFETLRETVTSQQTVYQWRRVYVRENKNNVCPTLTANMGTGGHNVPLVLTDYGIRKLTPKECFSLQGFPNTYKLPNDIAMSYLYKQAGNSVSVSVIKRIAEEILKVIG